MENKEIVGLNEIFYRAFRERSRKVQRGQMHPKWIS